MIYIGLVVFVSSRALRPPKHTPKIYPQSMRPSIGPLNMPPDMPPDMPPNMTPNTPPDNPPGIPPNTPLKYTPAVCARSIPCNKTMPLKYTANSLHSNMLLQLIAQHWFICIYDITTLPLNHNTCSKVQAFASNLGGTKLEVCFGTGAMR